MTYRQFCDVWIPLGESLIGTAIGILGSRQDAEDALQDLYIKLWQQRDILDGIHNPAGYATRVLKNLCIDRLRAKKPSVQLTGEVPGYESDSQPLENAEKIKILSAAIQRLPASQRVVLEMRTMQGLSYEEIAEQTGMSPLSLRVLLSKARKT